MFGLQIVPQVTSIAVLWRCEGGRVGGGDRCNTNGKGELYLHHQIDVRFLLLHNRDDVIMTS